MNAPTAQTRLRHREPLASRPEHVLFWNSNIGIADVGMGSVIWPFLTHPDITHDFNALSIRWHHEHRCSGMRGGFRIGHCHHNQKAGVTRIGGEPFLAVDDVLITILHGHARELRRVCASLRLRHRVA